MTRSIGSIGATNPAVYDANASKPRGDSRNGRATTEKSAMEVTFWGVRGSIPSPGAATVRYGGNTTCIAVRTQAGELLILDAGTGIYPLSRTLAADHPLTAHLLITHSHWDHIHGLPFFEPNFIAGNTLHIYGPADPSGPKGIEHVVDVQLQHNYFPVLASQLHGKIETTTLTPAQRIRIGSAWVTVCPTCHPVTSFAYRIDADGKSVFFTGDHEPHELSVDPDSADAQQQLALARERDLAIVQAMSGVDLLIADSTYTREEYPSKRGWGHGTFDECMRYAQRAQAKMLACTHHEPTRSDDALEAAFAQALARRAHVANQPECILAREGLSLSL